MKTVTAPVSMGSDRFATGDAVTCARAGDQADVRETPRRDSELADAVREGLTQPQKSLPPYLFYDEIGSALFEAICLLPGYGLTRADERILAGHAPSFVAAAGGPEVIAELGSGSGRKTRPILEALRSSAIYIPIDVSATALDRCVRELADVPGVGILPERQSYLDGLSAAAARRLPGQRILVLFLGSTIGNFEPDAAIGFLRDVRHRLASGDALLLGADLQLDEHALAEAYDDPIGVTAAFNLNLLARLNRELDATFDLRRWRHFVRWDGALRRIEMHLVSEGRQWVAIPGADLEVAFAPGESIWTESSYKFTPPGIIALGERAGFRPSLQRIDGLWPFSETLFLVD